MASSITTSSAPSHTVGAGSDTNNIHSATSSSSSSSTSIPILKNYINGHFVDAQSGSHIHDIDPATGKVSAYIPKSGAADIDAAAKAALAAFPAWSTTSATHRAAILDKIADEIERRLPELAEMEAVDAGKTLRMATAVDIPRAVANFRFFAGAIRHDETSCHAMHDAINYDVRVPIGVVGLISPWNLPLYLHSWKVAPALACGNCVVAKPSEITPKTASVLAEIIHSVGGLPPGVFNLVHGTGAEAGSALVAHPDIRAVSFTGGTATGKIVAATAAPLFKKLSLELGGKNSTVIFADVDIETAVAGATRAAFTNNGQICLAGSRIFVQRPLYDAFLPKFVERVSKLRVGPPLDPSTDVGPVSCAAHRDKIESYIRLATEEEGGVLEFGGNIGATPSTSGSCSSSSSSNSSNSRILQRPRPNVQLADDYAGGYFVQPCVISGLPPTSRVSLEEIFGPVVTVHPFDTEQEAIQGANLVRYGLSGSVWTSNVTTAHRVCRQLEAGVLWVNTWLHRDLRTPFGGIKDSGLGREGGKHSLEFYSEYKNVCVFMGAP